MVYATFQGIRTEPYLFSCWRPGDSDDLLVLVMESRIKDEPTLEWARGEGVNVGGGFMVPMKRWKAHVTPEGRLR